MDPPENSGNRIGRTIWTVWGYLSGAVARYLRPEVTDEGNQSVRAKTDDIDLKSTVNKIEREVKTNNKDDEKVRAEVKCSPSASVQWENDNKDQLHLHTTNKQTHHCAAWTETEAEGHTAEKVSSDEEDHANRECEERDTTQELDVTAQTKQKDGDREEERDENQEECSDNTDVMTQSEQDAEQHQQINRDRGDTAGLKHEDEHETEKQITVQKNQEITETDEDQGNGLLEYLTDIENSISEPERLKEIDKTSAERDEFSNDVAEEMMLGAERDEDLTETEEDVAQYNLTESAETSQRESESKKHAPSEETELKTTTEADESVDALEDSLLSHASENTPEPGEDMFSDLMELLGESRTALDTDWGCLEEIQNNLTHPQTPAEESEHHTEDLMHTDETQPSLREHAESRTELTEAEISSDHEEAEISSDHDKAKISSDHDEAKISSNHDEAEISSDHDKAKISSDHEEAEISSDHEEAEISSDHDEAKISSDHDEAKISSDHDEAKISSDHDEAKISSDHDAAKISSDHDKAEISSDHDEAKIRSDHDEAEISSDHEEAKISSDHEEAKISSDHDEAKISSDHDEAEISSDHDEAEISSDHDEAEISSDHDEAKISSDHDEAEISSDHDGAEGLETERPSAVISSRPHELLEFTEGRCESSRGATDTFSEAQENTSASEGHRAEPVSARSRSPELLDEPADVDKTALEYVEEITNQVLKEMIETERNLLQKTEPLLGVSTEEPGDEEHQCVSEEASEEERMSLAQTMDREEQTSSPRCEGPEADGRRERERSTAGEGHEHLTEVSRPGMKRGFDHVSKGLPEMKKEGTFGLILQAFEDSCLDVSVQKCRIAVKNPQVRPPKDPRKLLFKTSAEPRPSDPAPNKAMMGFKLPGLGGGLPVLRRTGFGQKAEAERTLQTPTSETEDSVKQQQAPAKPKWTPPRHPGMGSPFMMAELKNKLKKPVQE